jgi:hypothetical protein
MTPFHTYIHPLGSRPALNLTKQSGKQRKWTKPRREPNE